VLEAPPDLAVGSLNVATLGGKSDLGDTKAHCSRILLEGNSCNMDATGVRTYDLKAVMSGGILSLAPAERTLINMAKGTLYSEVPDCDKARFNLVNAKGQAHVKLPQDYAGELVTNGPACYGNGQHLRKPYRKKATNGR
jgi:hypothetical protein